MYVYKHYSFDLWMTLIRSNPLFKQERTRLFYQKYNKGNKSIEEIGSIFRRVDLMCNAINEKTGGNIDAEEMYLMVINAMNDYTNSFDDIDLATIYAETEDLVFKFLPVLYCEDTLKVLKQIKQAGNSTLSLLSNTAFIKGATLRTILAKIEMESFFDFQIYSDETGMSKPNPKLFQLMLDTVSAKHGGNYIDLKTIIHIGDNAKADIEGAQHVGINSLLINSNNTRILSLLN